MTVPPEGANEPVHLVCGFDEGYARPAGVMLRSVARTLRRGVMCVAHVVGIDLSEETRSRLRACGTDQLEIRFAEFDRAWIDELPRAGPDHPHLNATVYISLMTDRFLPPEVTRYVKLDADMIVRSSLDEIAHVDLQGKILGGMQDFAIPTLGAPSGAALWRELGLDSRAPYFNGGMLVVDRYAWRDFEVERQAVEYLDTYRPHVRLLEQEALNIVLTGRWFRLPARWNYLVFLEEMLVEDWAWAYCLIDGAELDLARVDPAIVHYASPSKPWYKGSSVPFRDEWWTVASDSPWAGDPPADPPIGRFGSALARFRRAGQLLRTGH